MAHHRAGRLEEAESGYRQLLQDWPEDGSAWLNLGVLCSSRGDPVSAVTCFDRAIACDDTYVLAHFNRAGALRALGRTDEARQGYMRAIFLDPELYEGHLALGFLWLQAGNRDRALDHFARTLDLRRGDGRTGIAEESLRRTTAAKLRHDAAQFRYVASMGRPQRPFEMHARTYEEIAGQLGEGVVALADEQLEALNGIYNMAWYLIDAPELSGGAVNPRLDRTAIEFRFKRQGVTWFDDLLRPRALSRLRRFVLESTIWSDFAHIDGFLATYLEDGLASPLFLQIVDEIRQTLPGILGERPLTQAWAFKALDTRGAIEPHSDDGAVSLNFWLTPDSANRNPDTGGLIVHDEAQPPGWHDGKSASETVRPAQACVIPYRDNRAVLFQSRRRHGSDSPEFRTGYENHRINVTLLYGEADA